MREILFRGKRPLNGKWLYGFYNCTPNGYVTIKEEGKIGNPALKVFPETVGQYTGMRDKNGVKIFEGDIVEVTDDEGMTNRCDCGIGEVYSLDGLWYIGQQVSNSLYDINKCFYIEVVGNIHDNEEILDAE